ncbi:MAG TPA: YihY/virulence factor BrkB family protein [Microbacteriaceae bacterium]|nr:YihY/virulence factor BrkB family protein [Microbacteriaceae bacterium]
MKAKIAALIAWVQATRPMRVLARFGRANGPLLANGLSYQAIFAAFAAIWVAFAIFGLWVGGSSSLRDAVLDTIADAVPGLIDRGEGGAISVNQLLSAQILGWTGAVAAVGLVWTSVGWFGAARSAVRAMLGQVHVQQNAIILKFKDAGLALGFGIALVISAALSLFATSLLDALLTWAGASPDNSFAEIASRIAGLVIGFGFDLVVLLALYSVLSAERLPRRALLQGVIGGALALEVLKALGGLLLGGAASNPLLASFAVIIGLLIWFSLLCTVLLLAAAWIGEAAERHAAAPRGEAGSEARTVPAIGSGVGGPE